MINKINIMIGPKMGASPKLFGTNLMSGSTAVGISDQQYNSLKYIMKSDIGPYITIASNYSNVLNS